MLPVKLWRQNWAGTRGSPSATCGPAHRGEGRAEAPRSVGRGKRNPLLLGCSNFSQVSVFLLPSPQLWVALKAVFSLHLLCFSPCDLIHSHSLSFCFSPASSPVSGALTSLLSLASAFLMKHLHPGGVNSFPSLGKQPPLDHKAAHPRRPH